MPGFRAYISAYIAKKTPPAALPGGGPPGGPSGGPPGALSGRVAHLASPVAVPVADVGPLINALAHTAPTREYELRSYISRTLSAMTCLHHEVEISGLSDVCSATRGFGRKRGFLSRETGRGRG